MNHSFLAPLTLVAFLFMSGSAGSAPLGTGFTYQGEIQRDGAPVNGVVHLRFTLWDAAGSGVPPSGGVQIGANQLLTDVPVQDGVFTVVLNAGGEFGSNAFNGEARWLQIEVCGDPGCSSLSILSPRQPVTGTPYSLRTLSAPWFGLTGVPGGFADGVDNIGDPVWATNGASIGRATGSVGIGTLAPEAKFQVNDGRIRIGESASPEYWDLFYDAQTQKFYLQENGVYNHLVFTKGPDSQIGIGTDSPNGGNKVEIQATSNALTAYSEEGITAISGIARRDDASGVEGYNSPGGTGVSGIGKTGVFGITFSDGGIGVWGRADVNEGSGLAGFFEGTVAISEALVVNGRVLKSESATRIDHPLDPQNKFLIHSSVESSESMNIYNGNIVLDDRGEGAVKLPDWFMALNKDFRYQLTPIGGPGEKLFIAQEVKNGTFRIAGGSPGLKVSWQVTGVRQDAWAKANPINVEQEKTKEERGKYLNPEVYGQPEEMGLYYRPENQAEAKRFERNE